VHIRKTGREFLFFKFYAGRNRKMNFLKKILQKVKNYFKKKDRPESLFLKQYQEFGKQGGKNEN
jgi:hypothetical protein